MAPAAGHGLGLGVLCLLLGTGGTSAAEPPPGPAPLAPEVAAALNGITAAEGIRHARILSDPKFRGREASSVGARKASLYIAEAFRRLSLRPGGAAGSYFQRLSIGATAVTGKLQVLR